MTLESWLLPNELSTCLEILGRTRCALLAPELCRIHSQASSPLPSIEPFLHASHSKEPPDTISQFTNCGVCPLGALVQRAYDPSGLPD